MDRYFPPDTVLVADCARASSNVTTAHINRVRAAGVEPEALARLGMRQLPFGALSIGTDDANRFWPDPDGFPAMIVPVYERGVMIDVIAFRTAEPARWWWRIGCAAMLGYDVLNASVWPGDRLRVVTTPLGWLAAAGEAVCLLDWSLPDHELSPMCDFAGLDCDTPFLASRLRKRLSQPRRVPPISIGTGAANVAA